MATKIEDSSESVNPSVKEKSGDAVNHPPHCNVGKIEVIDAIEVWRLGFCLGNAVKYIARAGRKSSSKIEDLKKALWYLRRAQVNGESLRHYAAVAEEREIRPGFAPLELITDWQLGKPEDHDIASVLYVILVENHKRAELRLERVIEMLEGGK